MIQEFNLFSQFAYRYFDNHSHFADLGKRIDGRSIFLTGGTGLFGQWTIAFLKWMHYRQLAFPKLTVLTRKKFPEHSQFITQIVGSVEEFEFHDEKFDSLIHLAAPSARETYEGMSDQLKLEQLYLGTRNVLQFAKKQVVGRSLFVSSGAIYGGFDTSRTTPIDETDRTAPLTSANSIGLGLGKRVAEFLVSDYVRSGFVDASIARAFSFVGPGLPTDVHYAVGNFAGRAIRGEDIEIRGDGTPLRSFMHMGDAIHWLFEILLSGKTGEDYNVGSPEPVSVLQLATKIRQLIDPDVSVKVLGLENKTSGNPANHYYIPCVRKAYETLGLRMTTSLDDSLRDYCQYLNGMHLRKIE